MTFFSILFALLIEQLKPLRSDNALYDGIRQLTAYIEHHFNAGHVRHGSIGWLCVMAIVLLPLMLVYWLCWRLSPFAAFLWNVLIVYLTLGLRHYSHYFTSIQLALAEGDIPLARQSLASWTKQDTTGLDVTDISRISIEQALITSHRHVFGVFFWFLIPIGPAGAVLYRLADYLARAWNAGERRNDVFGRFAARAFYWLDWIPVRLSAAAFAVVGNFEEAVYSWRNSAERWPDDTDGILLASAAGAMGLSLGAPAKRSESYYPAEPVLVDIGSVAIETSVGVSPGPAALRSTVGLIWRALLLWMFLLLLLSVTIWLS